MLIRQETFSNYNQVYELIDEAFATAEQIGIEVLKGIPSKNFMAIKLQENVKMIRGSLTYAEEFEMLNLNLYGNCYFFLLVYHCTSSLMLSNNGNQEQQCFNKV